VHSLHLSFKKEERRVSSVMPKYGRALSDWSMQNRKIMTGNNHKLYTIKSSLERLKWCLQPRIIFFLM